MTKSDLELENMADQLREATEMFERIAALTAENAKLRKALKRVRDFKPDAVANQPFSDAFFAMQSIARAALSGTEQCLRLYFTGYAPWDNGDIYHEQAECELPKGHEGKCGPKSQPVQVCGSTYVVDNWDDDGTRQERCGLPTGHDGPCGPKPTGTHG